MAIVLAGCAESQPQDNLTTSSETADVVMRWNQTFELEVGDGPLGDHVFTYDDCVLFIPRSEAERFRILNGTAVLTWDDSSNVQMDFRLSAEDGATRRNAPPGPSPLALDLPEVEVTWVDPMNLNADSQLPPSETMWPATMTVWFEYTGDQPRLHEANCTQSLAA